MSYRGKSPFVYDRNGKGWAQGASKNWGLNRGASERIDREFLSMRVTRYHRFTEPKISVRTLTPKEFVYIP
jgi:hypothetical protein